MRTKNRVAIYRNTLLPVSETFIRDQALSLSNWEPMLIGREVAESGLDFSHLHSEVVPYLGGAVGKFVQRWRWQSDPRLVRWLRSTGAKVVHAHFGTDATDVWPSTKAAGLPMVVTLHGYDISIYKSWWHSGRGGTVRKQYPERLQRMARDPLVSFIAVSESIMERAVAFGIPRGKVTVSHIGVDTSRFRPDGLVLSERRNRILFVGRMVAKKAPLLLIRAFSNVLAHLPDSELVMIGSGPLLQEAMREASSRNAPVTFLGARNSDCIIENLHQSKVFCLPSVTADNGDSEGLPISVLEALATGVPVVTSAAGASGEAVLSGFNGYCFRENDEHSLCRHLLTLLSNGPLIDQMSASARSTAEQLFSLSKKARCIEEAYSSATTP